MLTDREREILSMAVFENDEIAAQLNLSVGTIKWYFSQIRTKLNVKPGTTRTRLYQLGLQNGYIDLKKEGV